MYIFLIQKGRDGTVNFFFLIQAALEETKQEILSWRMRSEELASEMGQMRETAEARREEVRAAAEREAAALADLAEARAMLHQCNDSQGPEHGRFIPNLFLVSIKKIISCDNIITDLINNYSSMYLHFYLHKV